MAFNEIKGQQKAVNLIKAGCRAGRISHAYLFHGPQGVGKSKTARSLARLLNCENPSHDWEPCDCCSSCLKGLSGNHPDIIWLEPEGKSLKIGQMRSLQEKANYKCYEGKYKVIMIDDVQLFTVEAANSFLKVLEEPPDNTVFILIAQDTAGLPATVLSRCQPVPFSPLPESIIADILQERGINPAFPLTLARGSAGKALQLIEKIDGEKLVKNIRQLLEGLAASSYRLILAWAEEMEKDKDLLEASLEVMAVIYRDRLVSLTTGEDSDSTGQTSLAGGLPRKTGCLEALGEIVGSQRLLQRNANTRLVLEVLLLKLRSIENKERGLNPIG